jgi:hypothetical protein
MITFDWVLESGAVCGLTTIGEAVLNFDLHVIQLLPNDEIPEAITLVHEEYAKRGDGPIPPEIMARVNKEMEAYFAAQEKP